MPKNRQHGWQVYRRLLSYAAPYWYYLVFAVMGLLLSAATQPLFAWAMKPLLDKAILERDPVVIRWLPFAILLIFLIRGIAMFQSSYFMGLVGRRVVQQMRDDVFQKFLHLPVSYFQQHTRGKMLTQLTFYTDQVAIAATRGVTVLIQESAAVVGLVGLLFYHSWPLALGLLLIMPLIVVVVVYATRRLRRLSQRVQDSMGDVTQVGSELLQGYKVVRIFNGETYEMRRFAAVNEKNMHMEMKRLTTELLSTPIVQFLVAVALAAIVFIATRPGILETLSPGIFMSFITAMILLLTPLRNLTQLNAQLQKAIAAGDSIFQLLDEPNEPDQGTLKPQPVTGRIEFKQVSFCYPGVDTRALNQVSFTIEPGQKVAFVGRSGSGKTTLANLLVRFYDYQQGAILLDGMALPELSLSALRQQMAYVGQEIVLFNDTVRHNIAYGAMQKASEAQVLAAAQAAHALEFIEKLPQGLDTIIGDNGTILSGGQRQRLAIARAILANAPILILDEATSALDTESERQIQAALEHLLAGRTTLMIAHRLSTIESADKIIVLEAGQVIEQGTHSELLAQGGAYARLHALQFNELT